MSRKKTIFRLMFTLLLVMVSAALFAQSTVTGKVVDKAGNPLPGVSILYKGTSTGTITDLDGNYRLDVPEGSGVLIFSYIGFQRQEVNINGRSTIDIQMEEEVEALDEVVVIGYGSREKKDVTGAMSTITPEDFNPGVISNPAELMQGRISGVQVTPSSGEPGAGINVNVRGVGSIRSGNNPLFVIDGVPMSGGNTTPAGSDVGDVGGMQAKNPLNFLNPDDIASIDVLKDASATAIYGSRGANGVVLITTKSGKSGESKISYSGYVGVASLREKINVLSAEDYRDARIRYLKGADDYDFGGSTDWQDEIFQQALSHNHSVAVSGGGEKSNYRASISYMDQQGIVITSAMEKITGRINLNQTLINDRLKVGVNLTASNIKDRGVPIGEGGGFLGDALGNALRANPTMPVKSDTGYFQFSASDRNPVAMINLIDDRTTTDRILGNLTADLKIIEGLHWNTNIGLDKSLSTRHVNYARELIYITPQGRGDIMFNEYKSNLLESYLNYNTDFAGSKLSLMAGYSYQRFETNFHGLIGQGYGSSEILPTGNIGGNSREIEPTIYSGGPIAELQSFFGRAEYSYNDKYLATFSYRVDGSSRFGPERKYGAFPSGALAWRVSEEPFLAKNSFISNLKLRAGWGKTGNQEIPDYIYERVYFKDPTGGIQITRMENPFIQWETTTQTNVGIDYDIWGGRISGTADYFYKSTTDLLFEVYLPGPSPTERGWQNIDASVINKGFEFSLNGRWIEANDFSWSSTINFTKIDNTVEDLDYTIFTGQIHGQGLTGITTQVIESGHPLQSFYLREFVGYDDDGYSLYVGEEGERVSGSDAVLSHVGSPYPDYTFSVNNTFNYKDFDLNLFVDSKQGQLIYNNTANAYFNKSSIAQAKNITYEELYSDRNVEDAVYPSTRYLEDGSFVRLSAVTLGYNLPVKKVKWMSQARIYLSGQNLYVLTDYSGYDPEVNTNKAVDGVPSFGIDYTSYPRPRTVLLGVNVSF